MRDWFFNAGIIGFLQVVSDGKDIEEITGIDIGENYIEFEDDILNNFYEVFKKLSFLKMFKKEAYIAGRLNKVLKEFNEKKKIDTAIKINEIEKSPYLNFQKLLGRDLSSCQNMEELRISIQDAVEFINGKTSTAIYYDLKQQDTENKSIDAFLKARLKGVCAYENISKYIEAIQKIDLKVKIKINDICPSCQVNKKSFDFSNAVSNILGFNTDNSNWIWAFKDSNSKICPVCALIYTCAFLSFAFVLKQGQKKGAYLNCFYFLNQNNNVKGLFDSVKRFDLEISNLNDQSPFFIMIKETVHHINQTKVKNIRENMSFVEIIDNPILAGQGTKGYNVYSYNIDNDIAEFLQPYFNGNTMPKGFYKIKDAYFNLDEQLLKSTVTRQIDYSVLHTYLSLWLQGEKNKNSDQKKSNIVTAYQPSYVIKYVLDYINKCVRRDTMDINKGIVKKAFRNGIELKQKLLAKNKENQIDGIIYQLLNDLKIADREKFIDKYMRLVMSHGLPSMFGEAEMLDKDAFLQFGYSFINGIMSTPKEMD
jgi:CRISPR-associated protein Cst1